MMLEAFILSLNLDPQTNQFVVILKEKKDGKRLLPIWIGPFEANAIAIALEKVETPRPLTHDLIKNILDNLHIKVEKILIHSLKEGTFYATIFLENGKEILEIDSRPSDAMAIALRTQSPIFVESQVFDEAGIVEEYASDEELEKYLQSINPEEFKKQ